MHKYTITSIVFSSCLEKPYTVCGRAYITCDMSGPAQYAEGSNTITAQDGHYEIDLNTLTYGQSPFLDIQQSDVMKQLSWLNELIDGSSVRIDQFVGSKWRHVIFGLSLYVKINPAHNLIHKY